MTESTRELGGETVGSRVDGIIAAAEATARDIVAAGASEAEEVRLAVEAYAHAVRREAERDAAEVLVEAREEADRIRARARSSAEAESAELEARNTSLRTEAYALERRRDEIVQGLEAIAHDVEDAVAELAPEESRPALGEVLDVRRRR